LLKWLSFNALGTYLMTRFQGELVGEDEIGNRYYRRRPRKGEGLGDWRAERRWVVYPDGIEPEPTLVPPGWNGWLHKRFELPPTQAPLKVKPWEKEMEPNLTGTPYAYVPPGSERGRGQRDHATGDYEAWTP
jgi:NADH:ubiquinone oxidoreductase subunit